MLLWYFVIDTLIPCSWHCPQPSYCLHRSTTEQKTSLSLCWWCTYTAFKLDDRLHKAISLKLTNNNSNEKTKKYFIKHVNAHRIHILPLTTLSWRTWVSCTVLYKRCDTPLGSSLCLIMALVVGSVDKLVALRSAARIICISLLMAFVVVAVVLCLLNRCTYVYIWVFSIGFC